MLLHACRHSNSSHRWWPLGNLQQYWREVSLFDSNFRGDLSSSWHISWLSSTMVWLSEKKMEKKGILISKFMCQLFSSKLGEMTVAFLLLHLPCTHYQEKHYRLKFDQTKMRNKCLKRKEFDQFPTKSTPGFRSWHFPYREIELFCNCLMRLILGRTWWLW